MARIDYHGIKDGPSAPVLSLDAEGGISQAKPSTTPQDSACPRCTKWTICGCCCCACVLIIGIVILVVCFLIRNYLLGEARRRFLHLDELGVVRYTDQGLDMTNLISHNEWPGCGEVSSLSDFDGNCGEPCFSAKLIHDMHDFNMRSDALRVTYTSRAGVPQVELGGWWLPGNSTSSPRIVVQHGFRGSSNGYRLLVHAYMLRSLGFSVLLNNFRDHGYSKKSAEHINMWGEDHYIHDLLGAWDFAVNDPDGVLGGSLPASQVGLLGISMGAFVVMNAFGQEGQVPAAWADGAFFKPKTVFGFAAQRSLTKMMIGFLGPLFIDSVWATVEKEASQRGIDWSRNSPEASLRSGPNSSRPVFLAANTDDEVIPQSGGSSQYAQFLALLRSLPSKYRVPDPFVVAGSCHDEEHVVDHLHHFDDYRMQACLFWRDAFGLGQGPCGLAP